ncbi:MAG TPA: YihY/virulence factor BrkB family protein [Gemmatimonadaceae bacterium]|nr:YihY/virulence factor BrkB family protein [Gemmatimonadaceae bacterium]
MPERGLTARAGWLLRDYAKRVWDNSGEDNIFFLAGGISFNILLAAVPFFLLLATGLVYLLNQSPDITSGEVLAIVDKFLPPQPPGDSGPTASILDEVIKRRGSLGIYSAVGFIWFSTRLFGSLRTVLAAIFDIDTDRGIIAGKIFDIEMTLVSSLLLVAYTSLSAYLLIATTNSVLILADLGIRKELMSQLEYNLGQVLAFSFIATMFFCLYKFLPHRKIRWKTALIASLFTSVMLEIAKRAFSAYVRSFNPGSFYSGTVAALVIVVIWVYYAALIFIIGGEVAQVYELRRVRKRQREAFED